MFQDSSATRYFENPQLINPSRKKLPK